jgi:hypothetical protein
MKQFAESIWNIKKDTKKNKYILIFDQSEGIESLSLYETEYKELLKYRDPMNSISVYDLFQEKIFSYYNTGNNSSPKKTNSEINNSNKKRGRKPKRLTRTKDEKIVNHYYENSNRGRKSLSLKTNNSNSKLTPIQEHIEIAKVVSINYDFCHHCKQRKPAEVMVKCNSSNSHKQIEKSFKSYYINNTTLVKSKLKFYF